MKIRTPNNKYHFMLGTTSRVPGAPGWHYLILDIDNKNTTFIHKDISSQLIRQPTQSGVHIFTPFKMRLKPMLRQAVQWGADEVWARLALKRGWAFLADKGEVKIPWPVERMVIGWRKNNADKIGKRMLKKSS